MTLLEGPRIPDIHPEVLHPDVLRGAATSPTPAPGLPQPRGPITAALVHRLTAPPGDQTNRWTSAALAEIASRNALTDDDLQLALHIIYELSYRGYAEVDDAWEWDLDLLALRGHLERQFERELRRRVDERGLVHGATSVDDVLRRGAGPSLSTHVALHATLEQFVEFAIHRSAYQLKEADPHSWALPRFSGPRKAALDRDPVR